MAVYSKKWNGSAWVTAPIKKWNGSAWVDAYTYKWDGSKWVQIYPETIASLSFAWQTGGNFRSWREAGYETTTSTTTAKQGPYGSYTPAYGYLDISSASIPGTKNITSIHELLLTATRGGSGSYNADKTIYFYRSADAPTSVPTLLGGAFTCTAPGVGSGTVFYNQPVNVDTNTLNWTNQVGNGKYLWIYTNDANHYLSLGPSFKFDINYSYVATTAMFVDETSPAMLLSADDDYNSVKNTAYHTMTIYNDEVDMSLAEIMQRREDGIVEEIKESNVDRLYTPKPWSRDYNVTEDREGNKLVMVEVFGMQANDVVQCSVDGVNWVQMTQFEAKFCFMYGALPPDFNTMYDWVYVRCFNAQTEELYFELDIEPTIIIA